MKNDWKNKMDDKRRQIKLAIRKSNQSVSKTVTKE